MKANYSDISQKINSKCKSNLGSQKTDSKCKSNSGIPEIPGA